MRENPVRDKVFSLISWVIVFGLLFSAYQVLVVSSTGAGPVASAVGVTAMKVFYATIYTTQSLLLAYAKIAQRKVLRKRVLMSIYLFMGFTTLLNIGLNGWTWKFLDNAIWSLASAACWLNWTFRTEYVDPSEFDLDRNELKNRL